jgi:DNA-binding MarR family transcriptional regulator
MGMHNFAINKLCIRRKGIKVLRKDDDIVGTMLHDVAHTIRLTIDEALRPYDLTRVSWLAIGIVAEQDALSQTRLADALELGPPATGKLVDRLEDRGLIERLRDPGDRRSNLLRVTPEARRLLRDLAPVGDEIRERVLRDLGSEERAQLLDMLQRIKTGLSGAPGVRAA